MKKLTLLFDVHVDMINVKPLELGDPVQCTGNYLLGNKWSILRKLVCRRSLDQTPSPRSIPRISIHTGKQETFYHLPFLFVPYQMNDRASPRENKRPTPFLTPEREYPARAHAAAAILPLAEPSLPYGDQRAVVRWDRHYRRQAGDQEAPV